MKPRVKPTRRTLLRFILGAGAVRFFTPRLRASTLMPLDRLVLDHATEGGHAIHRRYRADAYIHLLAIPIFSRQDVGGGYAVVEQALSGDQSVIGLQFAGGSIPERTRGLNRVGLIQEVVVEQNRNPSEAAYFGFMVSSAEKNLDQARKSLQTDTAGAIPYSAAFGSGRVGRFQCTVSHLSVPARFNWANFDQLNHDMRARIEEGTEAKHFDVSLDSASKIPNTFLYAMQKAILGDAPKLNCPIVYNGRKYMLATEKQPDARIGQQLAARGVTHNPNAVWRLNGSTTETSTHQSTAFQVWYEQGDKSGLPLRIEFYPKSFLKLVFEQEAGRDGPKVSYLLKSREPIPMSAVAQAR